MKAEGPLLPLLRTISLLTSLPPSLPPSLPSLLPSPSLPFSSLPSHNHLLTYHLVSLHLCLSAFLLPAALLPLTTSTSIFNILSHHSFIHFFVLFFTSCFPFHQLLSVFIPFFVIIFFVSMFFPNVCFQVIITFLLRSVRILILIYIVCFPYF